MRKLRRVVPAAKLRRLTPLKAKMKNSTRWSSTYHMLQRYVEIKPSVMMIGDREIDALLPSVGQDRLIDELLLVLKDLDTATLALQGEEMSLLDVRNLFDEAMDDYPSASSRLSPDADIVANPDFENGVVKILSQMTNILNESERRSVERLKIDAVAPNEVPIDRPCLAERAKKRMKKTGDDKQFMDCRFIRPTSNICERLFSMAKLALTDCRRAMHPQTFEQQVFLKVNMAYWVLMM
ncbi:hypothetical protein AeMF1_016490 [Aphanomyces euteiches]|nr:hypothetical protein AeMF1_016490 [Aphanomyces euteiches]